jgi:2-furoyl-CoA dehydrogenase large subunit
VGAEAASETWVGQPLLRLEDEALLRGEGRFIDDLDPVANVRHAAVLRSPYAHARITRLDPAPAHELAGVVGVVTGADVLKLSRPFPAAIDSPIPHYAAATDVVRYVGEPVAVVVARDRYLAEDALELIEVEYEPLVPVLDLEDAVETEACVSDRTFRYGNVDAALAGADVVVSERFRFPRWSCTPVECYGVVAQWNQAEESLTAWVNFQGPFTLHSVAADALGLAGSKLRLITPPDSGGSFGIKSAVFAYLVLMGVASRMLGVPVRWTEDRLEHLAASSASSGRVTRVEAGFTSDGELVALRYDAIEDVGAYVRAPEPATLYRMHGSLAGAYRVRNVGARNRVVLTNTLPSGLNRGFGGPQLYLALERTMTIAANRLGLDPAELRRRNLVEADAFPYRTPSGALYDSGDYEACLDDALELAVYEERRAEAATARADGRLVGVGIACVVEPSISNMGYITLAEPFETRGLPKSGNVEGCTIAISAAGGITVRTSTTPQGQGHRTVVAQVVADRLGVEPGEIDVLTDVDTATSPWTIASGNYSSRFSGVGVGAVAAAADQLAERIAAIRDHLGDQTASVRRIAGTVHWNPQALPPGLGPGLTITAYYAGPNLLPPDDEDRIASSAAHGFVVDVAVVEVDGSTGEVRVLDYVTVHDAGRLLNPLLAEGQVRGGLAHGAGAALFERHVWDEEGNLLTASFMDYLAATAPDLPVPRIGHRESPSPFLPLGAKGLGEGTTMSVPAAIANAVADAIGRDDVEPPFTPARVWELLRS